MSATLPALEPVAIVGHAMLAPGLFSWADFREGRSAVDYLDGEFPVHVGARVPFDPPMPSDWPYAMAPRALGLVLEALNRLDYDKERRYGLVLGLPSQLSESPYVEHSLVHRDNPEAMAATLGFADGFPLDFTANQIGQVGPRLRLDSACATGNDALIVAHQWLRAGVVDDVLVCCGSAMLNPVATALFRNLRALNETRDLEASCPFDLRRRGFVMGEGAAAVWLSNDPDLPAKGWLCGYGQSMNADKFVDLPSEPVQMLAACRGALGPLKDVAYVSAHGTATRANDRVETRLHHMLFEGRARQVPLSSLKSMIGHCLGAAALIEAIVCLEALAEQVAPPTINLNRPDPDCDLDYVAGTARKIEGNFALSNAFAFGGHNSSVLFAGERP